MSRLADILNMHPTPPEMREEATGILRELCARLKAELGTESVVVIVGGAPVVGLNGPQANFLDAGIVGLPLAHLYHLMSEAHGMANVRRMQDALDKDALAAAAAHNGIN